MEQKFSGITTSFEITKAKLKLDAASTKEEMDTLCVKYEMGEERVKALVAKHWKKLNQKFEEALARKWKE